MPYTDHFQSIDDLIAHLNTVLVPGFDPILEQKYIGFISVSIVTCLELCIKDIIFEFAHSKHSIFGSYCEEHYKKINGRIKLEDLTDSHLKKFGSRFAKRFKRLLKTADSMAVRNLGASAKTSYDNIIVWRHTFAHEGQVPVHATFNEIKSGYPLCKLVVECFYRALK